jgi:23S rRNA (guanosine2251-2'-O)-methyltransferase
MAILAGIHPIYEALKAGRPLDRVLVAKGAGGPRMQDVIDFCRRKGVSVRFEPRDALDRVAPGSAHQGIVAFGAAHGYVELEAVMKSARMLVVLDGIEDPHNLGAIIRSANAAGADGVVIPDRRAAGLTETVAKASAGAVEYTPVARIGNVGQALEKLKDRGFWIYGLDERGGDSYDQVEFSDRAVLVLGAEGKGLHEHVKRHCDVLVRIPMAGEIASLNVSVAAGVVLFAWRSAQGGTRTNRKPPEDTPTTESRGNVAAADEKPA